MVYHPSFIMDKHELLKELIHAVSYFIFKPSSGNYTALKEVMLAYQKEIRGTEGYNDFSRRSTDGKHIR